MEPADLRCGASLMANWQETLKRDGFQVSSSRGVESGVISYAGRNYPLVFDPVGADEYIFELSQVSDRELYLRLERIFLASGARFNLSDFISSLMLLYRCPARLLPTLGDALHAEGLSVRISEMPGFGGITPLVEPSLAGSISRGGHSAFLETGPAFDPDKGAPAHFIQLRPKFWLRLGRSLESLLEDADAVLQHLGAQPVILPRDMTAPSSGELR